MRGLGILAIACLVLFCGKTSFWRWLPFPIRKIHTVRTINFSDGCKDEATLNGQGYFQLGTTGKFYKAFASIEYYGNAKAQCLSDGALLAMPKTLQELNHLTSLVPGIKWGGHVSRWPIVACTNAACNDHVVKCFFSAWIFESRGYVVSI